MKKIQIKLFLFFTLAFISSNFIYGQNDTIRKNFNDTEDLNRIIAENKITDVMYVDSTFSYSVIIPSWLSLMETGNNELWGGTFPKIIDIENALLIKGFKKDEFTSFNEFKEFYLTGNKFGQPAKFNSEMIWYGQNELIKVDNGVKQKVFILWKNLIYHDQFILLESNTAYIWIQFVATPDTYDKNIGKFEDFMKGFKTI